MGPIISHFCSVWLSEDPIIAYLNRINYGRDNPRQEYVQYVKGPTRDTYRSGAIDEFQNILHDFSLKSDDVDGIRKVRRCLQLLFYDKYRIEKLILMFF